MIQTDVDAIRRISESTEISGTQQAELIGKVIQARYLEGLPPHDRAQAIRDDEGFTMLF